MPAGRTSFKDHFSPQADAYARHRPGYPPELFAYLANLAPSRQRAWDCATGNGQAACGLAPEMATVLASDASLRQLSHARRMPGVHYLLATAEAAPLPTRSIDLTLVAQALHWLDLEAFYSEVRRVSRPGGILAVWGYGKLVLGEDLDPLVSDFYQATVGPYWPAERRHVDLEYRDLAFPFERLATPEWSMTATWTLEHLLGYIGTWSAVARYRKVSGRDPVLALREEITPFWGSGPRIVRWPLFIRLGRVSAPAGRRSSAR